MKKFTSLYTCNSLGTDLRNRIEQRVREKLYDLHTPDHPTYAVMIHRAIEGLNEDEGSTEEAISKFIDEDVEDLPQAHASFLRHHLNKLSESGEIVKASENRYMLPFQNQSSLLKRKHGQLNGTEDQIEGIKERNSTEEKREQRPPVHDIGKLTQLQEEILLLENLIELQGQKNGVIEKQNKLQTEVRSKNIDNSKLSLVEESENDEAIVTTQSSLISKKLENDSSLLPLKLNTKDKCIELLKRTNKIKEQLMDIMYSSSLTAVSNHDTQKPAIEEQEKENLKTPKQTQQIDFFNLKCWRMSNCLSLRVQRRGPNLGLKAKEPEDVGLEASITKLPLIMDSGQLEMEKEPNFPEGHPDIYRHQMPESLPVSSSVDVLSLSQELEMEEHPGLPRSGSPSQLKSSRVEPLGQKEQQQQANFCGKGKTYDYQVRANGLAVYIESNFNTLYRMIASGNELEQDQQRQQQPQVHFCPQRELAVDNIISNSLPSQHQHELQQQLQYTHRASSKLKPHLTTALGKLLPTTDMHIHEQRPMEGQGWGSSHRQKGDVDQNNRLSFPTADQNQCDQQQLKCQGQERQLSPRGQGASQPQVSASDKTMVLLPLRNRHEQQYQRKCNGQGRTKPDLLVPEGELLCSDVLHHHEQQLPKHRGWGRPSKSKGDVDPTTVVPLPTVLPNQNDPQKEENQCQGRLSTPKAEADVLLQASITVDHPNHNELQKQQPHPNHNELQKQQPERRGRGRPSKPKSVLSTTMEVLLPSKQQEQPQHKRRGRPPKRERDSDCVVAEPLTPKSQK
ncbi:HMG-Y-related protein A [Morella rubra]|uniref:HMG-Y-related protein A n=1 Tax=Morella rubra TaxID=262757 RepID=A0A6A1VRZ1_9ROSI|nr:HMG-Y-related protein A [Morella rubra]